MVLGLSCNSSKAEADFAAVGTFKARAVLVAKLKICATQLVMEAQASSE